MIFPQERPGDVAAQGPAGALLLFDLLLCLCLLGNRLGGQPDFDAFRNEPLFQATGLKHPVDMSELEAKIVIIDIAMDSGQDKAQVGLAGEKIDNIHRGARL